MVHGLFIRRGQRGFVLLLTLFCTRPTLAQETQKPSVPHGLPVFGRSVQVDPGFSYYQERSPRSVASEIHANGYRIVRYILTNDSTVNPALIAAFHNEGIGVWYLTFGNGTYSTESLPKAWPSWRMVTRRTLEGKPPDPEYTLLCLNHPAYRAWKKRQIVRMLRIYPFQGVDIVEPHLPEYPGPESPAYGCFCQHCLAAFRKQFPDVKSFPDILHPNAPDSPSGNPALWRKWLAFRRASVTGFLNELVNGREGIRQSAPTAKVCTWTLALTEKDGLQKVSEANGEEAGEIVRSVRPDLHCFQTHWPDWVRENLPADYVEGYRPFVAQVRKVAPRLPLMIQADTGSQKQNRRSWQWIEDFERSCRRMGVTSTTFYEYFLGRYMYTDPPRVAAVRTHGNRIELHCTIRLNREAAGRLDNYTVSPGQLRAVHVDGSIVSLELENVPAGKRCAITVRNLSGDVTRRLYDDFPATTLDRQTVQAQWR